MSGVLDPEELDALMAGEDDNAPGKAKYNLARQDYAVQRLIPALTLIQSQFAGATRDRMQEFVATVESVHTDKITVMKFDELVNTLPAPCSISVIKGLPAGANMFLAFESDLVFQLVDRYFGGSGGVHQGDRETLSVSEFSFMEMLNTALMADIGAAWKAVIKIPPTIEEQYNDPRMLDSISDADSLVATRFTVTIGEFSGGLWSIVPWSAIDAVRDSLGSSAKTPHKASSADWRDSLLEGLESAPIELVAVLTQTRLSLKKVSQLKVGDIIDIPSPEELILEIDGTPFMRGRFGSHQGNLAVRLEGPVPKRRAPR
ncbi:MAG: flagellar motor switch protein FliM [Zhongshania sp.]|jgi:flagellar motor switch protein FliM